MLDIIAHPKYKQPSNLNNDIALLKLDKPLKLNDRIRTVCLPKNGTVIPVGSTCFMSGKIYFNAEDSSGTN